MNQQIYVVAPTCDRDCSVTGVPFTSSSLSPICNMDDSGLNKLMLEIKSFLLLSSIHFVKRPWFGDFFVTSHKFNLSNNCKIIHRWSCMECDVVGHLLCNVKTRLPSIARSSLVIVMWCTMVPADLYSAVTAVQCRWNLYQLYWMWRTQYRTHVLFVTFPAARQC